MKRQINELLWLLCRHQIVGIRYDSRLFLPEYQKALWKMTRDTICVKEN